jgi:hypothetical protein
MYQVNATGGKELSAFVISTNPDKAYRLLKEQLNKREYGFTHDRRLDSIEVLGETDWYAEGNISYHNGAIRLLIDNDILGGNNVLSEKEKEAKEKAEG